MITLGIDIGSTTSKCALLRDGNEIIATSLRVGGLGTEGPAEALAELWSRTDITADSVDRTVVTGYGRNKYEGADDEVSELTCHALGGRFIFPELRTLIDIGGQDAKIISLSESGRMSNFVMNDKCAAGTGRFLDVMANILRMDIDELDECASRSESPASISSTCTVFEESEVISQLANGVKRPDLVAGICASVASRVSALARRAGVVPKVCMSGGVAKNGAVRRALSRDLEVDIDFDPMAQYFGAIGAALYGYNRRRMSPASK
jgi:predicted CoA-substrate-specific enzyme activase